MVLGYSKSGVGLKSEFISESGESYVYILPYDTLVRPSCYCSANCKAGSQHAREAISGEGVILGGHGSCTTPNSTGHQVKHEAV